MTQRNEFPAPQIRPADVANSVSPPVKVKVAESTKDAGRVRIGGGALRFTKDAGRVRIGGGALRF